MPEWYAILRLTTLTPDLRGLGFFNFIFIIILPSKLNMETKFKKDEARELKEDNKAYKKDHL